MLKQAQASILYKKYSGNYHMIFVVFYFLLNYIRSESFKALTINAYKKNVIEKNN